MQVLLIGDSIMDQQGEAAAFVLRQQGVTVKVAGYWGSGLLSRDQYDFGHSRTDPAPPNSFRWVEHAATLVDQLRPEIVAVYMNHNYWPPFPRDAAGVEITDSFGASFRAMVNTQVERLINVIERRGSRAVFVAPLPTSASGNAMVESPIWAAYQPALRRHHITVLHSELPVNSTRHPNGQRLARRADCYGDAQALRPAEDLHLTRYGAGLTGTALAYDIADLLHVALRSNGAPGDHTGGLAPTADGYVVTGCDGSVFSFGSQFQRGGARSSAHRHGGVRASFSTPSGNGMSFVMSDGAIAHTGDASQMRLDHHNRIGIISAAPTPQADGVYALSVDGTVAVAGTAQQFGPSVTTFSRGYALAICATPSGSGYWVAYNTGAVVAYGDAVNYGQPETPVLRGPVRSCASTPSGNGYWLLAGDGSVYPFGDATTLGNAQYRPPPNLPAALRPWMSEHRPRPVRIVAAPGPSQGYWIESDQGEVFAFGSAALARDTVGNTGTNNLALFDE